jgi:hypothetical protein
MPLSVESPAAAGLAESQEKIVSQQVPKESKEEPLLTAKAKKVAKQRKKHANDAPRFIKH